MLNFCENLSKKRQHFENTRRIFRGNMSLCLRIFAQFSFSGKNAKFRENVCEIRKKEMSYIKN